MMKNMLFEKIDIHSITERKNTIWILTIDFSIKIQAYVDNENYLLIEDDTMQAISLN